MSCWALTCAHARRPALSAASNRTLGFGLGEDLTPVVVLAIGRHDSEAGLPEPLAAREAAPRTRHPLGDLLLPAPAVRPLAA